MAKRQGKRKIVNINAELIYGEVRCSSIIENISHNGVYAVASPASSTLDFTHDSPVDLKFEFPVGQKRHLHCRIKWAYKTPPHELTVSIGMEVIGAPASYNDMLESM